MIQQLHSTQLSNRHPPRPRRLQVQFQSTHSTQLVYPRHRTGGGNRAGEISQCFSLLIEWNDNDGVQSVAGASVQARAHAIDKLRARVREQADPEAPVSVCLKQNGQNSILWMNHDIRIK